MSPPPFAPGVQPRPAAAARPPAPKRLRWTWLEWFLVAQTFIPALLFIPGISAGRVVIRVIAYLAPLSIWFAIIQYGRSRAGSDSYSVGFWLKLVAGWLGLMLFHWDTRSIPAGLAQATMYIAVFSPAFWTPKALESPRRSTA